MKISGKWIALLSAAVIVVGTVGVTLAGASSGSRAAAQGAIRDTAHAAQYWTNKELVKNADKIDLSNTTVNGETAQLTDGVLHLKKMTCSASRWILPKREPIRFLSNTG